VFQTLIGTVKRAVENLASSVWEAMFQTLIGTVKRPGCSDRPGSAVRRFKPS